jgi:hypothetical protein
VRKEKEVFIEEDNYMKLIKPLVETSFYTHNQLWAVCSYYSEAAKSDRAGAFYLNLGAMLLAFFTLEAYLNHIGQLICPSLWENEREVFRSTGTFGKLDFLLEISGISFDKSKRPYQTLKKLQQLRDRLAHGRPEHIKSKQKIKPGQLKFISSTIEKLVSQNEVARSLEDVKKVVDDLNSATNLHFPRRGIDQSGLSEILGDQTWGSA